MRILVADGIGSYGTTSKIVDHVANRLSSKTGAPAIWVPWKAAMFGGIGGQSGTWAENSREGVHQMIEQVLKANDDVVLLGYSGGNRVVHEFLTECPHLLDRVAAVGLMSDPWRPRDRWQSGTAKPNGWGVVGEDYGPIPERTYWTSATDDVISAALPDALMRYAADLCSGGPDEIIEEAIKRFRSNSFQLAVQYHLIQRDPLRWFLGLGPRIDQLTRDAHGYLNGRHTGAYTEPHYESDRNDGRSLAHRLADTIAYKVRKEAN